MSGRRIHMVGIGGIGMLALAQFLTEEGHEITGSDLHDSDALDELRKSGAVVHIGHDPVNVTSADLVVITAAAATSNPEVSEAASQGIPVMKRAELLGEITNAHPTLAISGTHGKTTTTGMVGHLLRSAGIDVTVLGGGFFRASDGSSTGPALHGSDSRFVVEADEYDRSFLRLRPRIAVITGIEFDHPDCYPSLGDMLDAYAQFANRVTDQLIVCGDSPSALSVARASGLPVETYGLQPGCAWTAEAITSIGAGSSFELIRNGMPLGQFTTRLAGEHNLQNSLAALAAATHFGDQPADVFREGLMSFPGMMRRIEPRGEVGGVSVVDDYAHHPTEITASLSALRPAARQLRVIFQPHTFTRTQALWNGLVDALSGADEIGLIDVYPAREESIPGVNSSLLADSLRAEGQLATYFEKADEAAVWIAETAQPGDVIVTMGAGDVGSLASSILSRLAQWTAGEAHDTTHAHRDGANVPRRAGPSLAGGSEFDRLASRLPELGLTRVRRLEPMSRHTSWRVGGPADVLVVAETPASLRAALVLAREHEVPCLVLGGGSNVLVSDQGIEGLVIINRVRDLSLTPVGAGAEIEAGSGAFFTRLAQYCAYEGFAGLEWGVAIPGTVGAGVVNNSGAHHGNVERALTRAEVVDRSGVPSMLRSEQLQFRYRESQLKRTDGTPITQSDIVVTRCWFAAQPDPEHRSRELIEQLIAHRRATQPISEPSAGSTFKNPPSESAGALIEAAGLKGVSLGGATVSQQHANFILNAGGATADDIAGLTHLIRRTVRDLTGIDLRPEVQLVGRWSQAEHLRGPIPSLEAT